MRRVSDLVAKGEIKNTKLIFVCIFTIKPLAVIILKNTRLKTMKYCPNCRTNYTDDTLKFCLQDGMMLTQVADSNADSSAADSPTIAFDDAATIATSRQVEQIRVPVQKPTLDSWEQNWDARSQASSSPPPPVVAQTSPPVIIAPPPEVKKSKTGLTVALTALATLLVLGGALGAWYFTRDRKTEVAVNVNTAPKTNRPVSVNSAANQNSNANIAAPTPAPTATPTPRPKLKPEEAQTVITDVEYVVDDWEEASENLDLDRHLGNYAATVDYYKAGRVGQARVRADKQKAFDAYDSINFDISNMKITPDDSGEKATAVFDKEWSFEGAEKNSSGKVQQQLTLVKVGGKWKIASEKDLKIYYVNN